MRIPAKPTPSTQAEYLRRVNLAIDHVYRRLDRPLRLEHVAKAAALSPFHFHRVFQAITGETLADFVKRLRLERALSLMAYPPAARGRSAASTSLMRIALVCGFSSSSDFSRSFKQRFGIPPSAFDLDVWRSTHRRDVEATVPANSPNAASAPHAPDHLHVDRLPPRRNPDHFKVRIRDLPARTVAYIRVRNPYRSDAVPKAAERLVGWAERHRCADNPWLGYQWENPELTSLDQCHYHVAVQLDPAGVGRDRAEGTTAAFDLPKGEIGLFRFPPMIVAEVEVRGSLDLELRALTWLYGSWLPLSGYIPDDHPAFEVWNGAPYAHGHAHFDLRIQLPVRRNP